MSHVTFDSGFGSSCSQPLLMYRPSSTFGSGRNTISRPLEPPPAPQRGRQAPRPAAGIAAPSMADVAADESVVQRAAPERVGGGERLAVARRAASRTLAATAVAQYVLTSSIGGCPGVPFMTATSLNRRAAFVDRRDERLDQRHRAVERARVAPGLEEVRFRHVPVAALGRFVVVQAEVHGRRHLAECVGKAEIGGRREHRIGAERSPASRPCRPSCPRRGRQRGRAIGG